MIKPSFVVRVAAAAMLLGLASTPGEAAVATGTMAVSATVLTSCTVTPGPLAFGNYDPTSATALDATATITILCTGGTAYTLGLDAGTGSGATITGRKMTVGAGTATLNYTVYNNSGRTTNWGDTAPNGALTGTATGLPQAITAYGRIPSGQSASAGAYTDTITVTLTY